jgi:excisionase family DNA binding protein
MTDKLTTTQCARALCVSGAFIRGEIRDGRLKALVFREGRKRAKYRIEREDFDAYQKRYWAKSA